MRWWGLPAVAAGFHSPAQQTCEADCRSAPTRCWPVKGQSHREAFRFQPRACDNCRLKSLQFFSFLAFYPEPVTTVLRQRTVTPTWQRYAVVAGAAGPRREPGSDNPHPLPEGIPSNPSLPGARPRARRWPSLGTSGALPWPWTHFQVFRGPEQLEDEEKYFWKPLATAAR